MRMRLLKLVPDNTNIRFVRHRYIAFVVSLALVLLSVGAIAVKGLNYGIDFAGGTLIEVRMPQAEADLARMRSTLSGLGLGEVNLQGFGQPNDVLIRVQRQEGEEAAQAQAVQTVRQALDEEFGEGIEYRRVEYVGPKVGQELIEAGVLAVVLSLAGIFLYLWFRFEWQYSVGATVATIHDPVVIVGLYAATGMEFNLTSVAAILTVVGYSVNDTVVVYDRVRENLRKYRRMELEALLDRSVNETLSRTVMTGMTTLLPLLTLYFFGGEVLRGFSLAIIVGILIGTYSSIYVAGPMLLYLRLRRPAAETPGAAGVPASGRAAER
jgi:preprotein translocase subunit SecF